MLQDSTFRLICGRLREGLMVLCDGRTVFANAAFCAMSGYSERELWQKEADGDFQTRFPYHERRTAYRAHHREVVDSEARLKTRDGHLIDIEIVASPLDLEEGFGELLVIRDNVENRRIQKELLKARQLESIAALSGGIAHDYNNLLTSIMGNISLCLTTYDEDSPQSEWLEQAQEAALIAKELTNRLITFSKGGTPQKETVDPAELILGATEFALSGSNVTVQYDFPPDLWLVDVDRMQVGQALHNIVINAREAMPDGGALAVAARNAIEAVGSGDAATGRHVSISIEDNGPGIAPDALNRIFDPYFTTKEMGTERGLGLGLSIANSIIEKHGGVIRVCDTGGPGACFEIRMPSSTNVIATTHKDDARPMQTNTMNTGRILVMDDDEMIRNLAGNILKRLGYEPAFAPNGEAAIDLYKEAIEAGIPFDAVILDLTVKGGLGGKETIQKLASIDPDVRGIVSSGYANDPGVTNYRDFGFCAVMAKPYRVNEISEQLEQLLGKPESKKSGKTPGGSQMA